MVMVSPVKHEAGQSAGERARQTREKILRLERSAAAWEAGAVGERVTGGALSELDAAVWTVWHDVRWPGRERANIDHVVVGPPGVFVIDSKNWSGDLTVANGVLRQNGHSRESAVAGVAEAGLAVFELVPDVPVHPVMCFAREEPLSGWVRDVMLCSTNNVVVMLQTRPQALTPDQVRTLSARLDLALRVAGSSARSAGRPPRRRPAPGARSAGSKRARRSKRRPSPLRSMLRIGLALIIAVALTSGVALPVAEWISKQIAEGTMPGVPAPADGTERVPNKEQQEPGGSRRD